MANGNIGFIARETLIRALPEKIPVRRSGREGARYPLYLSSPYGPWHMNCAAGQEVLLEGAVIGRQESPESPEPAPEQSRAPESETEPAGGGLMDAVSRWFGDLEES